MRRRNTRWARVWDDLSALLFVVLLLVYVVGGPLVIAWMLWTLAGH